MPLQRCLKDDWASDRITVDRPGRNRDEALDGIRCGVKPEDALYIGDGGDDELAVAGRAGLRAALATWFVSRTEPAAVPLLFNPMTFCGLWRGADSVT